MKQDKFSHLSEKQNQEVQILNDQYINLVRLQKQNKYLSDSQRFLIFGFNYLVYGLEALAGDCLMKIDPEYFSTCWMNDIMEAIDSFKKAQKFAEMGDQQMVEYEYQRYEFFQVSMGAFLFLEKTHLFKNHPKFLEFSEQLFKADFFKKGLFRKMYH